MFHELIDKRDKEISNWKKTITVLVHELEKVISLCIIILYRTGGGVFNLVFFVGGCRIRKLSIEGHNKYLRNYLNKTKY